MIYLFFSKHIKKAYQVQQRDSRARPSYLSGNSKRTRAQGSHESAQDQRLYGSMEFFKFGRSGCSPKKFNSFDSRKLDRTLQKCGSNAVHSH
ncbi:hypothetical protein SLEP1_g31116 [Rubroshorea leprosula]|uniref:Uncharacterized protein n=1 Tax=Rubroshorea leprosula TaxID=152421 RepID=A0AAV5KAE1_9ROSI|nr:hypothetical protein SLEP1_g31116 [Rubroshorea leprosula]